GGGTGGGGEPPCDLSLVEDTGHPNATRFCEGLNACWANIPSEAYPEPDTWPEEPPNEDAVYIYKICYGPDGSETANSGWGWYTPDEPSLDQLAWEAYGALAVPDFTLAFSPPGRAVIFIDTWWWAEGPGDDAVTASSGSVTAIAEPNRLEVDPGDGSGSISCDWVTTRSDTCTHVYERANADGYPAQARLVYDVRFESGGAALELAGLPETLESGWQQASVPVHEVQTIVE
uniref:hypothetical protein n=1 Tax=Streptomyces otsuchiensis TaxID=2681388 RepID=UPI0013003A04